MRLKTNVQSDRMGCLDVPRSKNRKVTGCARVDRRGSNVCALLEEQEASMMFKCLKNEGGLMMPL